jgi:Zn-dependent protease
MFRSLRLGTAFGIGVYVHWTFLLLLLFIVYMARAGGAAAAVYAVTLVLAIFGCVVLHEFGHALMARRFGIGTRDITLLPIGGVARLERPIEQPGAELAIALAGPAVNVVIAAVLLLILRSTGTPLTGRNLFGALSLEPPPGVEALPFAIRLLLALLAANGVLALFNLIPAFPMDGGRVLRALLALVVGPLPATEVAALLGTVFAVLLAAWGVVGLVVVGNPLTLLVALFVYLAGQQELAAVRHRTGAGASERQVVPLVVDMAAIPPEPHFSGYTWDPRHRAWIRWQDGRPIHACPLDGE